MSCPSKMTRHNTEYQCAERDPSHPMPHHDWNGNRWMGEGVSEEFYPTGTQVPTIVPERPSGTLQYNDASTPKRNVEAVNHPSHYGGGDNPHEHVKCATAWGLVDTPKIGAWLYNASKYVYRAGKKPGADTIQDLEKAVWYLQRAIARLKGEV